MTYISYTIIGLGEGEYGDEVGAARGVGFMRKIGGPLWLGRDIWGALIMFEFAILEMFKLTF